MDIEVCLLLILIFVKFLSGIDGIWFFCVIWVELLVEWVLLFGIRLLLLELLLFCVVCLEIDKGILRFLKVFIDLNWLLIIIDLLFLLNWKSFNGVLCVVVFI